MTYFYYSPKQADYFGEQNQWGGRVNYFDDSRSPWRINYVFDGDRMIPFTEQSPTPPEEKMNGKGWDDYELVFAAPNPKTIHSQEIW